MKNGWNNSNINMLISYNMSRMCVSVKKRKKKKIRINSIRTRLLSPIPIDSFILDRVAKVIFVARRARVSRPHVKAYFELWKVNEAPGLEGSLRRNEPVYPK